MKLPSSSPTRTVPGPASLIPIIVDAKTGNATGHTITASPILTKYSEGLIAGAVRETQTSGVRQPPPKKPRTANAVLCGAALFPFPSARCTKADGHTGEHAAMIEDGKQKKLVTWTDVE